MQEKTPQTIYLKDYQIPSFLIETVNLEFDLDEEVTKVKSTLTIKANPANEKPITDLELVGEGQELKSISLDGKPLDLLRYRVTDSSLIIYSVPEKFSLEIVTWIKPQNNTELNGFYKSNGNFCTQCEAEGFRKITYFLDRPDVMAIYTTTVIANEKKYPVLLSNGNPIASGKAEKGKHWVTWEDPFKKPSYLFALVAGDLEWVEDQFITASGRKVALRIYVEKGERDKCAHAMNAVKKAMRWDEEKFGREYDLDIYMIVAVSDFNMGAMENKGLNIFNTKYILAKPETATDEDYLHIEGVIAHEYCHNWSGNRITCRDWFQLSLKEGLTIFRDQTFTADTTDPIVARIQDVTELRLAQFPEDAGPLAHAVRPSSYIEINNFYTATVYNKGAEVIRMLQTIIGDELFRKGMDLYFSTYDGQAVTIEEFVKSMEIVSNIDLTQFRLWYSEVGTPIVDVQAHYDPHKKIYQLKLKQNKSPPLHIPIKFGLLSPAGEVIKSDILHLKKSEDIVEFESIDNQPVPSLLQHFSAPINIFYDYAEPDLALLFKQDKDLFNRWEAGQKYAIYVLLKLIRDAQSNIPLDVSEGYIEALEFNLKSKHLDKLYLSELLTLPSERYLAEQMDVIDVDAIHNAREFLLTQIATKLENEFVEFYKNNHHSQYGEFNLKDMAQRRLKNTCLHFLSQIMPARFLNTAINQFNEALTQNMTDTMAALRALSHIDVPERNNSLDKFFLQWQNEPLVVDKWLSIQAESKLPSTVDSVRELLTHPAFDIKNPNKVYALIGAFGFRNPINFHAKSGAGYQLLADVVLQLDSLNPNVASRMIKPLTDWRRFDLTRQQLMREQLEKIAQKKKLSRDIFEIVSKSLGVK